MVKRKPSPKCREWDSFTISIRIGNTRLEKSMPDLGVSINAMPYNIDASQNLVPLKETVMIVQLPNRINVYPKGVIEDMWM